MDIVIKKMDNINDVATFNFDIGSQKTKQINDDDKAICPFCNVDNLKNIYYQNNGLILLKNKFATLQDTVQLVLIESSKHNADIPSYHDDEWREILKSALQFWNKMILSDKFKSVVLYKNHGYLSGGTQAHPHMQIVGFKKIDVFSKIKRDYFNGILITRKAGVEFNISTCPIMGLLELNIQWGSDQHLTDVADLIKVGVHYVLNEYYNGLCSDYNLFFYKLSDEYFCKIVPRFVTSQYFVGYQLSQCLDIDSLNKIKSCILKKYLK